MRILLLQPPMLNVVKVMEPNFVHDNVGKQPPMGLFNLATYLEQNSNHEVTVLDSQLDNLDHNNCGKYVFSYKPDLVGVTATTMTFYDALFSAKTVKKVLPECKVILGGPHTSVYPQETIKHEEIDYLLEGEADIAFTDFVNKLEAGEKIEEIPGLYYLENGNVTYTGKSTYIKDLNALPIPNRRLTDYTKYCSILSKRRPSTNMMTSRGCPFKCIFCNRMGKTFRMRSAENILSEIRNCMELGIQDIAVFDDSFTLNRQRVVDICNGIIKEGFDFTWNIRTRVDNVDEELLKLLKKANCVRVHYGIESGNPNILKILNKQINLDDVKHAFQMTHKAGMETYAYIMIGSPEEHEDEIEDTMRLLKQIRPDYAGFSILTPMPNTELYDMAFENGLYDKNHWLEYVRKPSPTFEALVWDKEINQKRLNKHLIKAYKRFYGNPLRLFKRAISVRSFKEFAMKSKVAVKMFLSR
jgi:anaerobic magnesium-protoporphyrin IX monomethyl ester cyclase